MSGPPDFDAVYQKSADPWEVGASWYERRKQAVLLASLSAERYHSAIDPACGTAHAAAALARRSDQVLALDGSPTAAGNARDRFGSVGNLTFAVATLPQWQGIDVPTWDLLLLAEFVYYLPTDDVRASVERVMQHAADQCEIAAVHWAARPHDGYRSGRTMQRMLGRLLAEHGLQRRVHHDDNDFVLDTFTRGG